MSLLENSSSLATHKKTRTIIEDDKVKELVVNVETEPHIPRDLTNTTEWIQLKDPWARSRLLYMNPVCLLTTQESPSHKLNAMVITWLTCADNNAGIIASVHRKRHSATALQLPDATFSLSIPTVGMEELVVSVGSCSGKFVDKFETLGLRAAVLPVKENTVRYVDHPSIVAILSCSVLKVTDAVEKDHMLIFARATHGFVKRSHWDGKCFHGDPAVLSFLGSKRFAMCKALMDQDDEVEAEER